MNELVIQKDNGEFVDLKEMPYIEIPDKLLDIFLLDGIEESRSRFKVYSYNGLPVPRFSEIVKECIGKEFLMNWAARLGQKQFQIERSKATKIGSFVHEMIEDYLLTGMRNDISYKIAPSYRKPVETAFNNFISWKKSMESAGYTIKLLYTEISVVCPWYGGTIDAIVDINGRTYIIDFKTSKQLSFEYIMQTCSYFWISNNYYSDLPNIDGIGVIRIDKERKGKFEDIFLNYDIQEQKSIIDQYMSGFGSMVNHFYHIINMKYLFSSYKKEYIDFDKAKEK